VGGREDGKVVDQLLYLVFTACGDQSTRWRGLSAGRSGNRGPTFRGFCKMLFASNRIKKDHSFHNILSAWSVFVLLTAPGHSPELGCHYAAAELVKGPSGGRAATGSSCPTATVCGLPAVAGPRRFYRRTYGMPPAGRFPRCTSGQSLLPRLPSGHFQE
jgi:hypothetical protein